MTVTIEDALVQAQVLRDCAENSPVPQFRDPISRVAREWTRAASEAADFLAAVDDENVVIEVAGALVPGMWVWRGETFMMIARILLNGGQCSLHLEDPNSPRDTYMNLAGPTSPVVIRA